MRVRRLVFILLLAGISAAGAAAQAAPPALELELVVATRDDDRLRQWASGSPGVSLETVTEVRASETATAQARIRGCQPDARGRCALTIQYVATGPDGQTLARLPAQAVEAGAPPPALRLTFSDANPTGLYTVVAMVRDLNAKRMVRTERIFGLVR